MNKYSTSASTKDVKFYTFTIFTAMPLATRAIAQGVTPQVHGPKTKKKANPTQKKTSKKSRKRAAEESSSESNDSDNVSSDKPAPRKKHSKKKKRRHIASSDSDVEPEEVEGNVEPPEVEVEVVEGRAIVNAAEEPEENEEVHVLLLKLQMTYQRCRMMD